MVVPYLSRFNSIDDVLPAAIHSRAALNEAVAYLKESALIERLTELSGEEISLIDNALLLNLTGGLGQLRLTLAATPFDLAAINADLKERLISPEGEYLLSVQPASDLGNREATTKFINAVSLVAPSIAGRSVVEWDVGNVVVE